MTLIDLDDPKNRDKYLADLKNLVESPGWSLLVNMANETIEGIKNILENGMDNETFEDVKVLRANLRSYQSFIDTPNKWIIRLTPTEEPMKDENDPYDV